MRRLAIPGLILLIGVAIWFATGDPLREPAPNRGPDEAGPAGETTPGVISGDDAGTAGADSKPAIELPADGLPVAGTVVDEDGRPLPGAEIRIRPEGDDGWAYARILTTTTGTDGTFRLERVPQGRVRVIAGAPFRQDLGVDARAGDTEVRLVLAGAGQIHAELRLPAGWKLPPDYRIQLEYVCVRGPEHDDTAINDPEDDRFDGLSFQARALPPGRYRVWARILDLGCGEVTGIEVRAGGVAEAAIDIAEGGILTGLVLDPDGKPVPDALIAAVDQEWLPAIEVLAERSALWNAGVRTRTDASGRYRLVGLRAASYSLAVQAPGYALAEAADLVVPRKGDAEPIRLAPGGSLEFQVVGEIEDAGVYISLERGMLDGDMNEDGRGRIDGIAPGAQTVMTRGKGWGRSRELVFKAGETLRLEVRRPAGEATLTGLVTRAGVPQPDRNLRLHYTEEDIWFHAKTDASGRYRFESVPSGTPGVHVGRGRAWPAYGAGGRLVKLGPGESVLDLELATGRIRLRVVDLQTGEPLLARARSAGRPAGRNETAEDLLVVEDLEPGSHTLIVLASVHAPRRITATAGPDPEPVRVALVAGSLLEFRIRDEAGKPAAYPGISIVDAEGWDLADAAYDWGFADEQIGKYRYRLARGSYAMRVEAEGFRPWKQTVGTPVPGGGIEIVLRKE